MGIDEEESQATPPTCGWPPRLCEKAHGIGKDAATDLRKQVGETNEQTSAGDGRGGRRHRGADMPGRGLPEREGRAHRDAEVRRRRVQGGRGGVRRAGARGLRPLVGRGRLDGGRCTVALVRGYVLAGGVTPPADQGLLPPTLLAPAMDYAAYDLLKRLPVAVGEARRRAREDAAAVFSQVASGRMSVEPHGDSAGGGVAALPAFAAPPPATRCTNAAGRRWRRVTRRTPRTAPHRAGCRTRRPPPGGP